jgi:glucan phosphoethanolaminetransferase (alkaline phosphatase superfamily)
MVDFGVVIETLKNIGFYDVFLPFILVYVIVLGALEKSGIFQKSDNDKQSRSINMVISFVFGLFVVASIQTVKYIQSLIVNIVLFIVFILVVLILMGFIFGKDYFKHLFEGKDGKVKKPIVWAVAGVVLAVSVGVLFMVLGVWNWFGNRFSNSNLGIDWASIVVILAIIGVLFLVTKGDSKKSE